MGESPFPSCFHAIQDSVPVKIQNTQPPLPQFEVQKPQRSSFTGITQAQLNAGWEGWLAPAQCPVRSTLGVRHSERAQATLYLPAILVSLNLTQVSFGLDHVHSYYPLS